MKVKRAIRWLGLLVSLGLLLYVLHVYLKITGQPAYYHPPKMTAPQRQSAAADYMRQMDALGSALAAGQQFTLSFNQEQMNKYLGAINEIDPPAPDKPSLQEGGIAALFVVLSPDVLTLVIHAAAEDRVVSMHLGLAVSADGKLGVRLVGTGLGKLEVPEMMMDFVRDKIREKVAGHKSQAGPEPAGLLLWRPRDIQPLMGLVIKWMDGGTVEPHFVFSHGTQVPARIKDIRITRGRMEVDIVPLGRPGG